MNIKKLLFADLRLFDGEGGSETGGATGTADVAGQQASQAEATPSAQGTGAVTSDTAEAREKAFNDLITGEYKDQFAKKAQTLIDRRFKETKGYKETLDKQQPVIDMLLQRYKIADNDMSKLAQALDNDNAYWEEAAMQAGMTVEQYKNFQKLERENAALLKARQLAEGKERAEQQMQAWYKESEDLKGEYPGFDLATESQNPRFVSMLKAGLPVKDAYKVMHFDDILHGAVATATSNAEKQVVDNIRARGARPAENGTASQGAFTAKKSAANLTKEERAEYARRVLRGETITFD